MEQILNRSQMNANFVICWSSRLFMASKLSFNEKQHSQARTHTQSDINSLWGDLYATAILYSNKI